MLIFILGMETHIVRKIIKPNLAWPVPAVVATS